MKLLNFLQSLNESAADRYMQMFNSIPEFVRKETPGLPEQHFHRLFLEHLKFAMRRLQRQDRIIWYLRYVQFLFMYRSLEKLKSSRTNNMQQTKERIETLEDILFGKRFAFFELNSPNTLSWVLQHVEGYDFLRNATHYFSLNSPEINNIVWNRQTMHDLIAEIDQAEERWIAKQQQEEDRNITPDADLKKIIDFGNGWAWWLIPHPFCTKEGKAMGHCGNSAMPDENDQILSLREDVRVNGQIRHKPHLTFIINKGKLGEMKGFANEKPKPKYHPYIIKLLEQSFIKSIEGGGYAEQQNFSLFDLEPKDTKRFQHLISPRSAWHAVRDGLVKNELMDVVEDIIAQSASITARYASHVKTRFPKGDEIILKNPGYISRYITNTDRKRWPEGEKVLLDAFDKHLDNSDYLEFILNYAEKIIKGRWPEAEKLLLSHLPWAIEYNREILNHSRWPALEMKIISQRDLESMFFYAKLILRHRWKGVEHILRKNHYWWNLYTEYFANEF